MPSLLIILLATFSVVMGNNNSKQTGDQITVKSRSKHIFCRPLLDLTFPNNFYFANVIKNSNIKIDKQKKKET